MILHNNNPGSLLISHLTLRRAIGFLGISIPLVMMMGAYALGGCTQVQSSISHYYFTIMGDVFVGMLCATGILLIVYKGYNIRDRVVCFAAGAAILTVAMFPTSQNTDISCVTRTLPNIPFRIQVHYLSAAVFYLSLSYISLFLFTKSNGQVTKEKLVRNRVYRICGLMILVAILLIFLEDFTPALTANGFKATFWFEWVANLAYGMSWLVKGKLLLKDK